jgi:DNA-binding transcriptional LysR family regulator
VQFVDVRDLAEWVVACAESRQAGTFNVTGPEPPLTFGALLEEARRVLRQAEDAVHAARRARDRASARLRIGYAPDAHPATLARGLRRLAMSAPRIEVTLETGGALPLIEAVRRRRLDAAVVALPAPVNGLRTTSLGDEHIVAAVPVTDSRALDPALSIERLAHGRILLLPRDANPAFHNAIVSLCRDSAVTPSLVELAEPRVDLALLAVASGAGVALLPRSVKDRHSSPGVRLVDLACAAAAFEFAVVTHPDDSSLATRALLDTLARAVERPEPHAVAPAELPLAA